MSEMEKYGGMFDCQRFRDIMMYSFSLLSFGVPEAVRILADSVLRPHLKQEEVWGSIISALNNQISISA